MQNFSLLIKPASADCNLECGYCFYLKKSALYPDDERHRMPGGVLSRIVSSYMSSPQPSHRFGWQGGEPLLMGRSFFEKVLGLQAEHKKPGTPLFNSLQTNATLIDDGTAAMLAENDFLTGVSIDGPASAHDRFRRAPDGSGSYEKVRAGIALLKKHGARFNALTLVTRANAADGAGVYRFLRDNGIRFHQYIPCVEFDAGGGLKSFSVTARQWGAFLTDAFEEWLKKDAGSVSVGLFDSIINRLALGRPTVCHMSDSCCNYLLVEHNGDVYPCDFFVEPGLKLGNIMESGWEELLGSDRYLAFGRRKTGLPGACLDCGFLDFCMGDCLKHRPAGAAHGPSALCAGWKMFFSRTLPEFNRIASAAVRQP